MWHSTFREGVRLACLDDGGGPPVVLVHGLAGHAREWDGTAAWLSPSHRVVAPDARGHGRSERRPGDVSRAAYVDDLAWWIELLGLAPAAVIGQSLGAHTAFLLAARRPELVRALVVAEATPEADPDAPAIVEAWLRSWPVPFGSRADALTFFGDTTWGRAWADGLERREDGMWPAFDVDVMTASLAETAVCSCWEEWRRVSCPALVVRGIVVAAGAALLWVGIPLLAGTPPRALFSTAVGLALAVAILETGRRCPRILWLLPVLLVVELSTGAHLSASQDATAPFTPIPGNFRPADPPSNLVSPNVLLRPGPFTRSLGVSPGRYVVITGRRARSAATPHARVDGATPPFWFDDWPLTSGAHNIGGSNAIQLLRYWAFVRAAQERNFGYHLARFWSLSPLVGNLLGVKWVVVPRTRHGPIGFTTVAASGRWALDRAVGSVPMASLVGSWHEAPDSWTALQQVTSHGFDPRKTAVIEHEPGSSTPRHTSVGTASYRATGVDSAVITVNARRMAVVLLRIPYASGWHATLDRAPVAGFPVDYVDQGVLVPPGKHVVRMSFRDSTVTAALLVSVLWIGALIAAAVVLHLLRVEARSSRGSLG
ncbi:MAG TPA: alpha/beta fold hydrolase [Gaiellales bacterium]|nr:alpha/beta fold hydrolase [Gaiellales bacterium]